MQVCWVYFLVLAFKGLGWNFRHFIEDIREKLPAGMSFNLMSSFEIFLENLGSKMISDFLFVLI